jgi:hypothetical protein
MPVFGKDEKGTLHTIINELVERTNSETQRMRVVEQRMENLELRINSVEQNLLSATTQLQKLSEDVDKRLSKRDEKIAKMENLLEEMVKQFRKLATKSDVKDVEDMVDIYSPMKSNFVTREELEDILEQRLSEKKAATQRNK